MATMLKLTTIDGAPVWVNPAHIISLSGVSDKQGGVPMIGVTAVMVLGMAPIVVNQSAQAIASLIEDTIHGIGSKYGPA